MTFTFAKDGVCVIKKTKKNKEHHDGDYMCPENIKLYQLAFTGKVCQPAPVYNIALIKMKTIYDLM